MRPLLPLSLFHGRASHGQNGERLGPLWKGSAQPLRGRGKKKKKPQRLARLLLRDFRGEKGVSGRPKDTMGTYEENGEKWGTSQSITSHESH